METTITPKVDTNQWENLYYYPEGYYWQKTKLEGTKHARFWTEIDTDGMYPSWWTIWWDDEKDEEGNTKWTWRWISPSQYSKWQKY